MFNIIDTYISAGKDTVSMPCEYVNMLTLASLEYLQTCFTGLTGLQNFHATIQGWDGYIKMYTNTITSYLLRNVVSNIIRESFWITKYAD